MAGPRVGPATASVLAGAPGRRGVTVSLDRRGDAGSLDWVHVARALERMSIIRPG